MGLKARGILLPLREIELDLAVLHEHLILRHLIDARGRAG
jgi:hypothetical protein